MLFNFDVMNFAQKTNEESGGGGGGAESFVLLVFVLWQCFNCQWVMGCCRNSYIGPAEIASFFNWDFSRSNKYGTF